MIGAEESNDWRVASTFWKSAYFRPSTNGLLEVWLLRSWMDGKFELVEAGFWAINAQDNVLETGLNTDRMF